jgi:hypothetical protein
MTLPASAYRVGDRVIGEADGERLFGRVSEHHAERHAAAGDVLVYWSEDHDPGSLGYLVPAELLRLWPAAAHAARQREVLP